MTTATTERVAVVCPRCHGTRAEPNDRMYCLACVAPNSRPTVLTILRATTRRWR